MKSGINPFDSQETKPYKNDPEILAMTNLVRWRAARSHGLPFHPAGEGGFSKQLSMTLACSIFTVYDDPDLVNDKNPTAVFAMTHPNIKQPDSL